MAQDLLFTEVGHIGIITLNRPQALNALSLSMIQAMMQQLQQWADKNSILGVVICAAPGKVFCAGGDVCELYAQGLKKAPAQIDFFTQEYALNRFIYHYPKPYISLIDGLCMGGGVGITLHGKYRIATERFMVAMPETAIGLFPDVGASYLLSRLGAFGLYAALTGARIEASTAKGLGLIDKIIPEKTLASFFELLTQVDSESSLITLLYNYPSLASHPVSNQTEIDVCFNAGSVTAILEALKKLDSGWAKAMIQELILKSPTSVMVTYEQIHKAKSLNFDECLAMDACLVHHFMNGSDFYEGVRAMLIDKDKSPQWDPVSIEAVRPELVASYFQ